MARDQPSPSGIRVRKIRFAYPDDLAARWNPARPEWSQMVNAASLLMPYLEPFLIDAIRAAVPAITDPDLRDDARAYIGQEAHHFAQHRKLNDRLLALGYEDLRAYEHTLEEDYVRYARRSLRFRLAYAAGFETMALALGHMLVNDREYFFAGADPAVTSLVLWHFVEELEHKTAAFDVYQHVAGSYPYRVLGLVVAVTHTLRRTRQAYVALLRRDGDWGRWRTRWALKKVLARIFAQTLPWFVEALSPWHDPRRSDDPTWVREWIASYDAGEDGLTRLDTSRLHRSPIATMGA